MKWIFATLMLSCNLQILAQSTFNVSSPDKQIVFKVELSKSGLFYSTSFKKKPIVNRSTLQLDFKSGSFGANLAAGKAVSTHQRSSYDLVMGKASHVELEYNELQVPLRQQQAAPLNLTLVIRVFNDGVAFRYVVPQQTAMSEFVLMNEFSTFNLHGDPLVHALLLPNYTTSHEGIYSTMPISKIPADTLLDMPALFELEDSVFVAITEAALTDYAGMYLGIHDGVLSSKLSPLPKGDGTKVKATLPHASPWRVMLISSRLGALIESNIISSLNEPPKGDWSWLKPGKTTFPWWNGNVTPDTLNAPGNNFVTNQYYIDFCARNHIEYHSVVEYGLHQWYMDDGVGFQPGPHADVTTPVPGLDMKQICDYAKSKGVGIRVWVQWAALYPKLDSAFAIFERWGLSGMMVDFMDRDDQEMVNIQTEILQKAAAHHLHIQFHGAYKPTGLNRTYPNEFTREGTRNYEVDKWDPHGLSPDDDINIPFTRMLAGSTDYHLGGFRAVLPDSFITQYTRPLVLGTRCHMLGMYIVLENYLQMVCDYPSAYEGEEGFDFLKTLPTTWNETKVMDAKYGEYVVIARRHGKDWYLGAIGNMKAHKINVPLNFLGSGRYISDGYEDGSATDANQNHVLHTHSEVGKSDRLSLQLKPGGGAVMHFSEQGR